ncbi:uncharacterized protein BDZ99DRAFT_572902 [Mytilinidion resinicola]|uniref:Helicase C-terminal domain-containing protein n=1 Tax=Mytilinidion resinicola TaxID=574789 RepID=A0A6A6YHN0_9PEZI|nr:uncharacterized protein BDZ99DRAFT_572902 [Mytilinidion resinicola]KAF2808033.1 hypothetical protein BDZ99DRAFT_572902 [Mytilinidion resinicola]
MLSRITSFFSPAQGQKRSHAEFEQNTAAGAEDDRDELMPDYIAETRKPTAPRKPISALKPTPARKRAPTRTPAPTRKPAPARRLDPARKLKTTGKPATPRKPLDNVRVTSQRANATVLPPKRMILSHVEIPVIKKRMNPLPTPRSATSTAAPAITATENDLEDSSPARPRRKRARVSYVETWNIPVSDDSSNEVDDEESDSASTFSREEEMELDESSDYEEDSAHSDESSEDMIEDPGEEDVDVDVDDAASVNEDGAPVTKSKGKATFPKLVEISQRNGIDRSLPPISDIKEIFKKIAQRALELGLKECLGPLQSRFLNVATMCSGTESPILALQSINDALEELGQPTLPFKHCFSAESEPFKQAYIERNFDIDIIFRDIEEFTIDGKAATKAYTAYGALVPIPKDIDLLIAGFVCKDRSMLNAKKKKVNQKGQTLNTFNAILAYAKAHRPSIVILENIMGDRKDWEEYKKRYENEGFECSFDNQFDNKNYYLPQTRNRGYMICLDRNKFGKGVKEAVTRWLDLAKKFERKASSPLTEFVLPADDPRVQQARKEYLARNINQAGKKADWEVCRGRAETERSHYKLGEQRPFTNWVNGGSCVAPDYVDGPWLKRQVERVWDCLDVHLLRNATPQRGSFDSRYKMRVWNLSQNCDRFKDTQPFGIAPCLTPTGIPFMTDRGARATGYDFLLLQGIPIDKILFTTETDEQIQDLGGNSMGSTVVGVVTLSALIVAFKSLPIKERHTTPQLNTRLSHPAYPTTGLELLENRSLQEHLHTKVDDIERLKSDALSSRSMCFCEGQGPSVCNLIQHCESCRHTACTLCAGSPVHEYGPTHTSMSTRMRPQDFRHKWEAAFPTRVTLEKPKDFGSIRKLWRGTKPALSQDYANIVTSIFDKELLLQPFTRSRSWKVRYDSPAARLELILAETPEWRLYAKASSSENMDESTRAAFEHPIARSVITDGRLLPTSWEPFVPQGQKFKITSQRSGELRPSWRATLGLPEFKEEKMATELIIGSQKGGLSGFDFSGTYTLRPKCGTAKGYLFRRVLPPTRSGGQDDVFLFLDPSPLGDPRNDCFVFSKDHGRLPWGEQREVIARLDPVWEPLVDNKSKQDIAKVEHITATVDGEWRSDSSFSATVLPVHTKISLRSPFPTKPWAGLAIARGCSTLATLLECKFDLPSHINSQWASRKHIGLRDKSFFDSFSFVLRRIQSMPSLNKWESLAMPSDEHCETCAPATPTILWQLNPKSKRGAPVVVPYEHPLDAIGFEKMLKERPAPFRIELDVGTHGGKITISHNVQTMVHRAVARLAGVGDSPRVSWKLITDAYASAMHTFPRFTLKDNDEDDPEATPDGMKKPLFEKQERSLAWMIRQEDDAAPPFTLREVEEAALPHLNWRAEVKAEKNIRIRGGVLADKVGFGKTILILGLAQSEFDKKSDEEIIRENSLAKGKGPSLINISATLVVASGNITKQWRSEIITFLGKKYDGKETLLIENAKQLEKLSVEDFTCAKFIIVQWRVLFDAKYVSRLSHLTAMPEPLTTNGRVFASWLDQAISQLPTNLQTLKREGIRTFEEDIQRQYERNLANPKLHKEVGSKQLQASTGSRSSKSVQEGNELADLKWPVLQLFRYNRIVVDEYPYLQAEKGGRGKDNSIGAYLSITRLQREKMWILSGTPDLDDFSDVKRLAAFFQINLGADTKAPSVVTRRNLRKIAEDRSKTEEFLSFRESRSNEWHQRRHEYAQGFLDRFARQNKPDIKNIPYQEHLSLSNLNLTHRILYTELMYHFGSNSMMMPSITEAEHSDRNSRINRSIAGSRSPEGALLKSSCFIDDVGDLPTIRQRELDDSGPQLEAKIVEAEKLKRICGSADTHYGNWRASRLSQRDIFGDPMVSAEVQSFIKNAQSQAPSHHDSHSPTNKDMPLLRKLDGQIRTMERIFLSNSRSVRYAKALHRLHRARTDDKLSIRCDKCRIPIRNTSDLFVIPNCGHFSCGRCLHVDITSDICVVEGCDTSLAASQPIGVDIFQHVDTLPEKPSTAKLEKLFSFLHIIKTDQVLLFVPDYELLGQIDTELAVRGIRHLAIKKNDADPGSIITTFQGETQYRVLVLNIFDVNAAGVNLQCANHVMFLSPLLAPSQHEYEAKMEQAIGRVRRYGQKKAVHIYHFANLHTIDVDAIQRHHRRSDQLVGLLREPELEPKVTMAKTKGKGKASSKKEDSLEGPPIPAEPTQLVTNKEGEIVLVPVSWLTDCAKAEAGNIDPDSTSGFSTLTMFSETYGALEEF